MKYKAKDGLLYNIRTANKNDLLEIVKVHNASAITTYQPHMEKYPVLKDIFSKNNLVKDWQNYLDKSKDNNDLTSIVIEKIGVKNGTPYKQIVGVAKAATLQGSYKIHMENIIGKKIKADKLKKYANLQTIYIDPKHQGLGLGKGIMGYFANQYSDMGCKYALTETLSDYEVSPKFFHKVGGAKLLGEYTENVSQFVVDNNGKNNDLPFKLWLMNDMDKMKITCHLSKEKSLLVTRKHEKLNRYANMKLALAGNSYE